MSANNEDKVSNTSNPQKEEKDMDSRLYALSNDNPENRVKYIDEPMLDLMYRK